jgi:hypothetical protein
MVYVVDAERHMPPPAPLPSATTADNLLGIVVGQAAGVGASHTSNNIATWTMEDPDAAPEGPWHAVLAFALADGTTVYADPTASQFGPTLVDDKGMRFDASVDYLDATLPPMTPCGFLTAMLAAGHSQAECTVARLYGDYVVQGYLRL